MDFEQTVPQNLTKLVGASKSADTMSFQLNEPMYFSSGVDLLIVVLLSVLVIFVNGKYLNDMNEDDRTRLPGTAPCLISDVMRTRTKSAMVLLPFNYFLGWFLALDLQFPEWFYHMICSDQYLTLYFRFYYSSNSLIISLMRYVFIVHNRKVLEFGKDEAKKLFYYLSVGMPLVLTIAHACTIPVPEAAYNKSTRICSAFYEASYNITCGDPNGVKDDCAPILSFVLRHVPSDVTVPIGAIVKVLFALTCTNVLDGILYWKTFKKIRE